MNRRAEVAMKVGGFMVASFLGLALGSRLGLHVSSYTRMLVSAGVGMSLGLLWYRAVDWYWRSKKHDEG
jgi:predicted MFS family arabinose efflux permease